MEFGIYLELELFAEPQMFKAKDSVKLLDLKFPLFTVGERDTLDKGKDMGYDIFKSRLI
jgi:hypothetical protein